MNGLPLGVLLPSPRLLLVLVMHHVDAVIAYLEEHFQPAKQAGWVLDYHFPGEAVIDIHATHGDHAEQLFSSRDAGPITSPAELEAWAHRCTNVLFVLTPSPLTWSGEMNPAGASPLGGLPS